MMRLEFVFIVILLNAMARGCVRGLGCHVRIFCNLPARHATQLRVPWSSDEATKIHVLFSGLNPILKTHSEFWKGNGRGGLKGGNKEISSCHML